MKKNISILQFITRTLRIHHLYFCNIVLYCIIGVGTCRGSRTNYLVSFYDDFKAFSLDLIWNSSFVRQLDFVSFIKIHSSLPWYIFVLDDNAC
jgi:hypothetical protein